MTPLPIIEFGDYAPDVAVLSNASNLVENALPRLRGYSQLRDYQAYTSTPLASKCLGALSTINRASGDTIATFAGDVTRLYKLVNNYEWEDRSPADYVGVDRWRFVGWRNNAYAVSREVPPQVLEITDSGNFANLTTTDVQGAQVAVWRYHLVLGDIKDADGTNRERVRWSAYEDATNWDISSSTLADFQDLDGNRGRVMALVSGTTGMAFQEHGIWRADWVGAPYGFRFDLVDEFVGTLTAGSVIRVGSTVFFLAQDGFRAISVEGSSQSQLISNEMVTRRFFADLDLLNIDNMSVSVFEGEPIVVWSYPGRGNKGGLANRFIIYNYTTNKWAQAQQEAELIFPWYQEPISIDAIDGWDQSTEGIDNAVYGSFDSRRYLGGGLAMGIFGSAHNTGLLSGSPKVARFETGELEHAQGKRTRILGVRPVIKDGPDSSVNVELLHRNRLSDDSAVTPSRPMRESGMVSFRKSARYVRYRVTVDGGFDLALGVQPYATPGEMR